MNNSNRILLSILFVCFAGCNTKPHNTTTANVDTNESGAINADWVYYIDKNKSYEKKNLYIQDIATVDYIKLETTPDCLLGSTSSFINILLTDKYIFFAMEDNVIFRYDYNGKFYNKINREGRGPEEYGDITSIAIDDVREEVLVYDASSYKLFKYSYDGKFINSVNMGSYIKQIGFLGGDTLACFSGNTGNLPAHTLRSSSDGRILKSLSGIHNKNDDSPGYMSGGKVIKNNGEFFVNTAGSDTIFSINKNRRTPRYILTPPKTPGGDINRAYSELRCETDYFCALMILSKNTGLFDSNYIVDKKEYKVYKGMLLDRNFGGLGFIPYNSLCKNNQFATVFEVGMIESSDGELRELADLSDENDNPILMIATLK